MSGGGFCWGIEEQRDCFLKFVEDLLQPWVVRAHEDGHEVRLSFHSTLGGAYDVAAAMLVGVEPCYEQPVAHGLPPVAGLRKVQHHVVVLQEELLDDGQQRLPELRVGGCPLLCPAGYVKGIGVQVNSDSLINSGEALHHPVWCVGVYTFQRQGVHGTL